MAKRLDILVNLIKQGNGGKAAKDDLGGIELSAKEADISIKALDTRYRKLIREVEKGNKTVDDARREYREFANQLGIVESQTSNTQLNVIALNQALELGKKAFNGVQQAAQVTFETLQEGERLTALRNTFDNLAGSLGNTDDLLNRLQTSTSGAVNQTILMEAANKALNLRLATTDDELVKLVGNAAALGANLGDVGGTIDNVLAAIANESKLRLDNFGVAASRVEELQAQLQAAGEEGTFAQAVMIALEETVDRTGARANLAADDMGRLQSAMQDAKNEALLELIAAFGEDLPSAIDKGVAAVKDFSDAFDSDDIRKTIDFLDTLWKFTAPGMAQALLDAIPEIEETNERLAQMPPHVRAARQEMEQQTKVIESQNLGYLELNENLSNVTEAADDQAEANRRLIRSTEGLTEEQIAQNLHLLRTLGVARQFTRTMNNMGDDYELLEPPVRNANRAIQGTGEAAEEAEEAVTNYADAIQLAREAELAAVASLGDYATSVQLAADNTFDANAAIFQHIDALNASPEATIAAGLALGQYTEAQARARLEALQLEKQWREIDAAVDSGRLTADQAIDAYLGLANGTYESARAAILASDSYQGAERALSDAELGAGDMTSTLDELKARLLGASGDADAFAAALRAIPNEIAVKILLEQSGSFVPPPDTVPGGQYGGPRHAGGPVAAGTSYLVGDGPGGSFIPGATELFMPGQSGYVVSNRQVEAALQNINNSRTVHYSDRSSVNFNMRGLNVRQAGRSLNRSRRQHLNRSLYG